MKVLMKSEVKTLLIGHVYIFKAEMTQRINSVHLKGKNLLLGWTFYFSLFCMRLWNQVRSHVMFSSLFLEAADFVGQ